MDPKVPGQFPVSHCTRLIRLESSASTGAHNGGLFLLVNEKVTKGLTDQCAQAMSGKLPLQLAAKLVCASLTQLLKPNESVRPIAVGQNIPVLDCKGCNHEMAIMGSQKAPAFTSSSGCAKGIDVVSHTTRALLQHST